ncbi:MAG: hypothetical protein AAGB26_13970 [Planctomycetota bacterium]
MICIGVFNRRNLKHHRCEGADVWFLTGTNQFTLTGFESAGYGTGSTGNPGPPWFLPVYIGMWVLLWAIGLFVTVRAAERGPQGNPNKDRKNTEVCT